MSRCVIISTYNQHPQCPGGFSSDSDMMLHLSCNKGTESYIAGITVCGNKLLWKWRELNQQINPDLIPTEQEDSVIGHSFFWSPNCNLLLLQEGEMGWTNRTHSVLGRVFSCKLFQIDLCANWSHRQCNKHCRRQMYRTFVLTYFSCNLNATDSSLTLVV